MKRFLHNLWRNEELFALYTMHLILASYGAYIILTRVHF